MCKINFKNKLLLSTVIVLMSSNKMMSSFDYDDEANFKSHAVVKKEEIIEIESKGPGISIYVLNGVRSTLSMIPEHTLKMVVVETSKATGMPLLVTAYNTMKNVGKLARPGDEKLNQGTIARVIGDKVNSIARSTSLGEKAVQALEQVTPVGYNSVTENVLNNFTFGLGRIKVDVNADASEIAAQVAHSAVKKIPVVGGLVANLGSKAGHVTSGVYNAFNGAVSGLSSWWYSSSL